MEYNNRLNRNLEKVNKLPKALHSWAINRVIGKTVPMVGSAGIKFEKITCEELIASLPNNKKVQNHISQVHAAASVLLAETATGILFGMNVPDDKLPLMKKLSAKYIKRSVGEQKAYATLTSEQIQKIRTDDKGDVNVAVKLIDETDEEIVIAEMVWAWIPKKG